MLAPPRASLPTARRLAEDHRAGRATVLATARRTLDRLAEVEPEVRAFAHVDDAAVLRRARELDAVPPHLRGPLHGVPVAIKDVIDTADLPTAYGSPIHAGHLPARDAEVVARLRAAGALVVGKTVTAEFALLTPGPTRNPHDPTRTPGGSSSGSAAAVAAGVVPLALGTQTAGSTVRPASYCGVVGLKPTFGLVPTRGVRACAPDLDTVGVLAVDAADARLALDVLGGRSSGRADAPPPSRPLRLGWWPGAAPAAMEPAPRAIVADAVAALDATGEVSVTEVRLPAWFGDLIAAQRALMRHQVWHALAEERTRHLELLSPALRERLAQGPDEAGADAARRLAASALPALGAALAGLDALLTPSVTGEAPADGTTGDPDLCRTWTLLGVPAVAVPGLRGPTGLPLGVQVVAHRGDDDGALRAAERLAPLLEERGARSYRPG